MWFHKLFQPNLHNPSSPPVSFLWRTLLCLSFLLSLAQSIELESFLSQHGVHGSIKFLSDGDKVRIRVNLTVSEDYAGEYSWGIYQFPIDYSVRDYCDSRMLGRKPIVNFDESLGKLLMILPEEEEPEEGEEEAEDASEKKKEKRTTNVLQEFSTEDVALLGKESIWGRSLVLEGPSKARVCGTIAPKNRPLKTAEARFKTPVAGSIWFQSLSKGNSVETKVLTNLFHTKGTKSTSHAWKIFITDILDQASDIYGGKCDFLQIVYDPQNKVLDGESTEGCSWEQPEKCLEGDMSGKFKEIRIGKRESMFTKGYHTDLNLELPELDGPRSLFVVIYDHEHPDSFLGCAKIADIEPRHAEANFMHKGISGQIAFDQQSPFHPVVSTVDLKGLEEGAGGYHVHEFPKPPKLGEEDQPCSRTAGHYNPFNVDKSVSPPSGTSSFDKYEVGDLSGKYGSFKGMERVYEKHTDPNLSLFGQLSIVGRSVVIHHNPIPHRWVCANIETDKKIVTAEAVFTYPIAGRIVFRQEEDNPNSDTSVFVESLLYSDGTKNDTQNHPWHVHVEVPGKDYFNWTGRCLSAEGHYNPYGVNTEGNMYNDCRNEHIPLKCELGDLVNKHKGLSVAGKKRDIRSTVNFFTDVNLPLSGAESIIGHSIVIHDDHAPVHRGNRMACTGIYRQYRHKAVATKWFGNGIQPPPVSGKLEFIQDTKWGMTYSLVDLHGMKGEANSYHVHKIPVQDHLEFPCTGDAVGGHFNPYQFDASESPKPAKGTPDQYEIGDLSGKYGLLEQKMDMRGIYNDTNLPLYGIDSIVGRSIVVHKKYKAQRWACASIGWGFDPDEAKEIRAIASFHHPDGFAWGYIRFSQVVYRDGSTTDTTMEVRLKYPGKTNKEISHDHNWSIYVNPVHHDAAVKFQAARCTAAGYRWNPTHIQLADPNDRGFYAEECGPDYPLRCEVGDISGRMGKISIGSKAYVINDGNLPLSGDWWRSAVGKSIVIHGPNQSPDRMACANIEADKDIVKYATIRTKARFNLATFMEDVQAVMGIPEWFLYVDSRKTKNLYGGKCIQIQLHFTGPQANRLEQDFNRLLRTGKLDSPSIAIPGYFPTQRKSKLGYRECGTLSKSPLGSANNSPNDLYTILNNSANHLSSRRAWILASLFLSLSSWVMRR